MNTFVAAVLLTLSFSAFGHGGEDHGAPPPALGQSVAPRAVAATEDFEVVAALEDKQLFVYVDRFASNEPVAGARIEIEGAGLKGIAAEVAPGTYVMKVGADETTALQGGRAKDALLAVADGITAARHALTISIEAGDLTDLLSATLDTTAPVASEIHVQRWSVWTVWAIAGLVLLASIALLIARRKQKTLKGQ